MSIFRRKKTAAAPDSPTVGELNATVAARYPRRVTPHTRHPTAKNIVVPYSYVRVGELIDEGSPLIFVSGNAGTGKTTLIHHLRRRLNLELVVLAPTGVAALNAGGSTIHSFFRFPPRMQDAREINVPADRRLYRKLDLLVIDEISMVRADLLDQVDVFLRKCRDGGPFGDVQLLLVGDMFQLPPVVPRQEGEILEDRGYASPYFFSARSLQEIPLAHVELGEVFRQSDPEFISLLNRLRVGEDTGAVVTELNARCCSGNSVKHEITLTCTNKVADTLNETAMEALNSPEVLLVGKIEGRFNLTEDRLPSPIDLRLKTGARVMFTKNDDQKRWVNGSLGVVESLDEEQIRVRTSDGQLQYVEPATWQNFDYRLDSSGHVSAVETGSYTQYPLMLAWAITIHKSQGKTLDNIVVDFGSGAFAPGQAYVALSRCRSIDNVRLARPLRSSDVMCDPRIVRFYESLAITQQDEQTDSVM